MPETYPRSFVTDSIVVDASDVADSQVVSVSEYRGGQLEYLTGTPANLDIYTSLNGTTFRKLQVTLRDSSNAPEAKDSVVMVQANYNSDLPPEIFGCKFVKFVGFDGTIRLHLKG